MLPIIWSDGSLCLIKESIDKAYGGDLKKFIIDIKNHKTSCNTIVCRLIIDDIVITNEDLNDVFEFLVDENSHKKENEK